MVQKLRPFEGEFEKYRLVLDNADADGNLDAAYLIFNRFEDRLEPRRTASLLDRRNFIVNARYEFSRNVQLPAQLTHISDARCTHDRVGQFNFTAAAKGKGLVRHVDRGQRLKKVS